MIAFLFGIICLLLALVCYTLLKTYEQVPVKELKRLARKGDQLADLLYRPAAYGISLKVLLGGLTLAFGIASLVLLVHAVGLWLAILLFLVLGVAGSFIFIPSGDLTRFSLWLATRSAPFIAAVLVRLHPAIEVGSRLVQRLRPIRVHTGMYEKSDLAELLEQQKGQPDNRIDHHEIDLLSHALTFGDKLVGEALIPKRVVKLVPVSAGIGPVLMSDLHKSGHSRFPVYEGKSDNIVGVLYLHDLVKRKQTGTVKDVMKSDLRYIHEDFSLFQTLQAFLKTKRHLFIVVNSFEEFVGIITIEDVLEQMIGRPIVDEFDQYDDLRAVASAAAKTEHAARQKAAIEPTIEPNDTSGKSPALKSDS